MALRGDCFDTFAGYCIIFLFSLILPSEKITQFPPLIRLNYNLDYCLDLETTIAMNHILGITFFVSENIDIILPAYHVKTLSYFSLIPTDFS